MHQNSIPSLALALFIHSITSNQPSIIMAQKPFSVNTHWNFVSFPEHWKSLAAPWFQARFPRLGWFLKQEMGGLSFTPLPNTLPTHVRFMDQHDEKNSNQEIRAEEEEFTVGNSLKIFWVQAKAKLSEAIQMGSQKEKIQGESLPPHTHPPSTFYCKRQTHRGSLFPWKIAHELEFHFARLGWPAPHRRLDRIISGNKHSPPHFLVSKLSLS